MIDDHIIDEIRDARKKISEKCNHNPKLLIEYYIEFQKKYQRQLDNYSKSLDIGIFN
jgi:hypothetical protein